MISCKAHDYIEIACMLRLNVRLHLNFGAVIEGIALDITRTEDNQEALLIERDQDPVKIALTTIQELESVTSNPHFSVVNISNA